MVGTPKIARDAGRSCRMQGNEVTRGRSRRWVVTKQTVGHTNRGGGANMAVRPAETRQWVAEGCGKCQVEERQGEKAWGGREGGDGGESGVLGYPHNAVDCVCQLRLHRSAPHDNKVHRGDSPKLVIRPMLRTNQILQSPVSNETAACDGCAF